MRMSSVDDWVVLRIWKRVEPTITNRKNPISHGPIAELSSFFWVRGKYGSTEGLVQASVLVLLALKFHLHG